MRRAARRDPVCTVRVGGEIHQQDTILRIDKQRTRKEATPFVGSDHANEVKTFYSLRESTALLTLKRQFQYRKSRSKRKHNTANIEALLKASIPMAKMAV
ncbi:MAG TPA: hypothetical protein VMT64_05560 [Candidatus Binataceae bacterium]|nr:hypothetical protein [Candidatus Binataceae bacterium]